MIIKKRKNINTGIEEQVKTDGIQSEDAAKPEEKEINLFDLDNIDFKQRQERRKGDRRRGFRRIDDRNLISRAREEADSIREAASKEGYQEGIDKSKEDISQLAQAISVFYTAKQDVFDEIAPDILEISLDIAKKIIKKEASEDPEVILSNVKEILKGLSKEESKIMLKVNPAQAAIVEEKVPPLIKLSGLEAKVLVIPDENIMEGGCLVTTTNGVIDATIETQIGIISEALKVI
jgi:flagellar assembly protein FliH